MQKVIIIREINCYESKPTLVDEVRLRLGMAESVPCKDVMSVWLTFKADAEEYTETGTRIIGPVPGEQAEAVIRQLESAFGSAGFEVRVETLADD